jgi:hypothetical protein
MNTPAAQCEFESGNNEELIVGERFAKSNVLLHSAVVEYFCMVAHRSERHARPPQDFNYTFKRLLPIGKEAVDVQNAAFIGQS